MRTKGLAALALLVLLVTPVLAMPRSADEPAPPLRFAPVPGLGSSVGEPRRIDPSVRPTPRVVPAVSPLPTRPIVDIPEPDVIVVDVGDGSGVDTSDGHSVAGVASWYCGHGSRCTTGYPSGLYAAIRRDLLSHRGGRARVCGNGRCVIVTIIDCNCGPNANLVDLYTDAFSRLAPLSRGRINVTLEWL